MRALLLVLAACGPPSVIHPSAPKDLPVQRDVMIDTTPKERRRMVPPEVYLRAYLTWFGGLAPLDVQNRARPRALFDAWDDYLAALGLPDYRADLPRSGQSNTLMLATLGRLGEALCIRAAEHDLHDKKTKPEQRVVYRFAATPAPSIAEFGERFDVLHRMFLGYPAALAPADRVTKFHALYDRVVARHAKRKKPLLGPDETAWATICAALVQHPETELY